MRFSINKRLIRLCKNNLYQELEKTLIQNKFIINDAEKHTGMTPIMYAARYHSNESVYELLKNKIDINRQDHKGLTVVMHAFETDNVKIVNRIFAKHRPDLTIKNNEGMSIMDMIVKSNKYDISIHSRELYKN